MDNDNLYATGMVTIRVYDGNMLVQEVYESNLVVTLGKTNITHLLGGNAAGKRISHIAVGTNGAAAVIEDNTLTNMFSKLVDSATYPDSLSVQFNFDIDNDEANGITIREFGLLNEDGVLCARKIRTGEIVKTSAIRILGSWKITIN